MKAKRGKTSIEGGGERVRRERILQEGNNRTLFQVSFLWAGEKRREEIPGLPKTSAPIPFSSSNQAPSKISAGSEEGEKKEGHHIRKGEHRGANIVILGGLKEAQSSLLSPPRHEMIGRNNGKSNSSS